MNEVFQEDAVESGARHVRINRDVHLYDAKRPYSPSGVSILGAIEYDVAKDRLRCHECGEWVKHLANHSLYKHGVSAKEYRAKHGLRHKTALVNEEFRVKRATEALKVWRGLSADKRQAFLRCKREFRPGKGKYGWRQVVADQNASMSCRVQILERIKNASAAMGIKSPTMMQLSEYGIPYLPLYFHFGGLENALAEAGLTPHGKGAWRYSDEELLEALRSFWITHMRRPSESDHRRGLLASAGTYRRRFGSVRDACDKALAELPAEAVA